MPNIKLDGNNFVTIKCLENGGLREVEIFSNFFLIPIDLKDGICDNTRVFKYQKVFGRFVRGLGPVCERQNLAHCVPGRTEEVRT